MTPLFPFKVMYLKLKKEQGGFAALCADSGGEAAALLIPCAPLAHIRAKGGFAALCADSGGFSRRPNRPADLRGFSRALAALASRRKAAL